MLEGTGTASPLVESGNVSTIVSTGAGLVVVATGDVAEIHSP